MTMFRLKGFNMRVFNWSDRLNEVMEGNKEKEFSLGTWDCGIFISTAIQAITGSEESYCDPFVGKYTTEAGFLRVLKKHGYGELRDIIYDKLGEPIHSSRAHRGDVVIFNGCAGINLGTISTFIGSDYLGRQTLNGSNFVNIHTREVDEFFKVR